MKIFGQFVRTVVNVATLPEAMSHLHLVRVSKSRHPWPVGKVGQEMNFQAIGIMRAQVLSREFADFLDKEINSKKDLAEIMTPLCVLNDIELAGVIANVSAAFENKEIMLVILGMWLTMRRERSN